jgi:hypothetical protein
MRKTIRLAVFAAASTLLLAACGSSDSYLNIPAPLPDVCQGIDFSVHQDMREPCGVTTVGFQAYRNVPLQRTLINPRDAQLVKTGSKVELRLTGARPIELDTADLRGVSFAPIKRLEKIENTMEYKEFMADRKRYKLFKLNFAPDSAAAKDVTLCFQLTDYKSRTDGIQTQGKLEAAKPLTCHAFDSIVQARSK